MQSHMASYPGTRTSTRKAPALRAGGSQFPSLGIVGREADYTVGVNPNHEGSQLYPVCELVDVRELTKSKSLRMRELSNLMGVYAGYLSQADRDERNPGQMSRRRWRRISGTEGMSSPPGVPVRNRTPCGNG